MDDARWLCAAPPVATPGARNNIVPMIKIRKLNRTHQHEILVHETFIVIFELLGLRPWIDTREEPMRSRLRPEMQMEFGVVEGYR